MCSQLLLQISSCSCVHSCTGFVNCYKEGESSWYSNSSYSRSFGRCDFTFSCSLNQPFSERKEKKHFQHFFVVVRLVFLSSSPDPLPPLRWKKKQTSSIHSPLLGKDLMGLCSPAPLESQQAKLNQYFREIISLICELNNFREAALGFLYFYFSLAYKEGSLYIVL